MGKILNFLNIYSEVYFGTFKVYSDWAQSEATNEMQLIELALLPGVFVCILYWLLPIWLGKTIAIALMIPPMYIMAMLFKHEYA